MSDITEARKAAKAVYLATEKSVADDLSRIITSLADEIERLREALRKLRGLVVEGGVPRYKITPGAALNNLIEEVVDPILKERALEGK